MALGSIYHIAVMGEEDRLHRGADSREGRKAVLGAPVVERGEEVVADEGRGLGARGVILEIGEAQREVELVSRALAHVGNADLLANAPARRAAADQMGHVVVVEALAEASEIPSRQGREQRA